MKEKINIDERYFSVEELQLYHRAEQKNYYHALRETFDIEWDDIGSFIDVGCREGYLLKFFSGMDYFEWGQKIWAVDNPFSNFDVDKLEIDKDGIEISGQINESEDRLNEIREKLHYYDNGHIEPFDSDMVDAYLVWDLRDSLENTEWLESIKVNKFFDIVNCTEVAEHVDSDYCNIFMKNLKSLTNKYLVISWSPDDIHNGMTDPYHQHINALSKEDFEKKMKEFDFVKNDDLTDKLLDSCKKYNAPDLYIKNELSVWELK